MTRLLSVTAVNAPLTQIPSLHHVNRCSVGELQPWLVVPLHTYRIDHPQPQVNIRFLAQLNNAQLRTCIRHILCEVLPASAWFQLGRLRLTLVDEWYWTGVRLFSPLHLPPCESLPTNLHPSRPMHPSISQSRITTPLNFGAPLRFRS